MFIVFIFYYLFTRSSCTTWEHYDTFSETGYRMTDVFLDHVDPHKQLLNRQEM